MGERARAVGRRGRGRGGFWSLCEAPASCAAPRHASVTRIVVEHRDRLARFGVEHLGAALSAQGREILVVDAGEVDDDLVRDMTEVLTSFCARLYGRHGARNRALRAITAAKSAEAA